MYQMPQDHLHLRSSKSSTWTRSVAISEGEIGGSGAGQLVAIRILRATLPQVIEAEWLEFGR
jgi:hypothetical protein